VAHRETATRKPQIPVRTAQVPEAVRKRDGADRFASLQSGLGNRGFGRLLARQFKRASHDPIQRADLPEEEEMQFKRGGGEGKARGGSGGSNGIPDGVLQKMEAAFGADFSDVKVHVGQEATDVGALAFTQGNDIHFAPGLYNPDTPSGQELLGHELAHVVQQREGRVQPTGEVNGVPLNDDPSLEAEADRLGKKAAAGG